MTRTLDWTPGHMDRWNSGGFHSTPVASSPTKWYLAHHGIKSDLLKFLSDKSHLIISGTSVLTRIATWATNAFTTFLGTMCYQSCAKKCCESVCQVDEYEWNFPEWNFPEPFMFYHQLLLSLFCGSTILALKILRLLIMPNFASIISQKIVLIGLALHW